MVGYPPLMEMLAEKVLCDKLCNYGGGSVGSGRLVNRPES